MVDSISAGSETSVQSSKWNLTGTSQFTDSTQDVVNGGQQLSRLDEFIGRKIQTLVDDSATRGGQADRVFLSALREFRGSLISAYGVAAASASSHVVVGAPDNPAVRLTYRDLTANFGQILESVARDDTAFPKTLAVNAFRGYLNEFVATNKAGGNSAQQQRDGKDEGRAKGGGKRRKERWKNNKQSEKGSGQRGRDTKRAKGQQDEVTVVRYLGHEFTTLSSVITIPTACEVFFF